jgi:hypothetical protein
MKVGGKILTDTVKAFRLFTTPIQLLALAQDRLANFCERVRARVPEEQQQEASPSIALPILMDLRFMEDTNPLTELYLNLLARAIDRERCGEAHPAFVKIIEQMSPDEAVVMSHFRGRDRWPMPPPMERGVWQECFPILSLAQPESFPLYAEHLAALNLLKLPRQKLELHRGHQSDPESDTAVMPQLVERDERDIEITMFGKQFVLACIPSDLDLAKYNDDNPLPKSIE